MKNYLWIILAVILFLGAFAVFFDPSDYRPVQQGTLKLSSPAFGNNGEIPQKYTCDGDDVNPPLQISGIPEGTQSLVLIVDDPDAPLKTWTHWVVYNIPPGTTSIPENSFPQNAKHGINTGGSTEYSGPCPPSGTHRYIFKLYALNTIDTSEIRRDKASIENFMKNRIIDQTQLTGVYSKQ
jgi:hypothetical protein